MQLNIQRQVGATLIEIIMVVALIAIITIGALTYYNSASESSKVQETISGLTGITAVIRNQFSSQGDYNGLTEELVARSTSVPNNMKSVVNTDHLRHPWSQTPTAVQFTAPTTPFATFTFRLQELPQGACVEIASKIYKSFESVSVNGVAMTPASGAATASLSCTTGNANILQFTQR